jgi:hypothetical protein
MGKSVGVYFEFLNCHNPFRIAMGILSRLGQNFILKKFWEIEYLTIYKKLKLPLSYNNLLGGCGKNPY